MKRVFSIIVAFSSVISVLAQDLDTLRIMSYNIENFYYYDSRNHKSDKDFTPYGSMHWTRERMTKKAKMLARVVMSINGRKRPDLIGFQEIGGPEATRALLNTSHLNNVGYKWICYTSHDHRGLATALLYNADCLELLNSEAINVSTDEHKTRDILYAKFRFRNDTIHVLVNHWPSKYGELLVKEDFRYHVATIAHNVCDSILATNNSAKLILMGDFNETADDEVLKNTLGADGEFLINLSNNTEKKSYKYLGTWSTIDHIIVSPACFDPGEPTFRVGDMDFLLEEDDKHNGMKPYRTYIWKTYHGGYSDHLPVFTEIPFK